jgi:hypothetical protein
LSKPHTCEAGRLKIAAAAGFVAGIRVPPPAALTCAAMIRYFAFAVAAHIRVHYFRSQSVPERERDAGPLRRDADLHRPGRLTD